MDVFSPYGKFGVEKKGFWEINETPSVNFQKNMRDTMEESDLSGSQRYD